MRDFSEEHYQQGRAIYDAGHSIRELILTANSLERRADEEHAALDQSQPHDNSQAHAQIADRYRSAEPSLITGFADRFLEDVRRAVPGAQRQGSRA